MTPPTARIGMVYDTYFGTTVADPYRWLEDWEGAEARAWLDAQAACARAFLDALPARASLLADIAALDAAGPALSDLRLAGGRTFYMRGNKLVVRAAPDAEEQVLLDPDGMAGEESVAVTWYAPSPHGRFVAYGLARGQGGSMESILHVLDVDGGRTLDLAISRASPTVRWLDDNGSFLYHRFTATSGDAPPTERFRNNRTYLHCLGDDPEDDRTIFARGLSGVEIDEMNIPLVHTAPCSAWLIGEVLHGVTRRSLYVAPSRRLDESGPCRWTKVADVDDAVHGFALGGDTLYLLTDKEAPRRKVLALALHDPDLTHATVLVPESQVVIEEIRVAGDYLLTRELDGGIMRLRRVARGTGESRAVALPIAGTVMQWASEATHPVVLLQLTAWTMPPCIYRYDAGRDTVEDTAWWPPPVVDAGNLEAHDVHVSSHDGTQVPLSIIHKKGLARDGTNPTLLQGYGSHGIALTPTFSAPMLAWYERGGILAVAHVRGGGEYGAPWHAAGRKLNKQKGVDDFIACAEYLIARGYTRSGCLAGAGMSAGGILVGNALVQRPDLWAAVILEVPVVNALRFEVTQAGVGNVSEFGSVATEEGFRALYQMDAYTQVRDGMAYPAVLLTTGLKDPSTVGQAAKMAARLQAATTSGKPVLLRVEGQGGHGFSSPELLADKLAFLLSQCG